jgi:hypothetical protein
MIVSEAFLIVVDDLLSLYSLASPYACPCIEELVHTGIYRRIRGGYLGIEVLLQFTYCSLHM